MGLKDFKPATETISFPGGDFAVRGLGLVDLTVLLRSHYDTASALFDKYVSAAAQTAADAAMPDVGFGQGDVKGVILGVLETAPQMISDAVALAADEPDMAPLVAKLPLISQIAAVEAVVRLTLEAEGGMEKLIETVNKMTTSLAGLGGSPSR